MRLTPGSAADADRWSWTLGTPQLPGGTGAIPYAFS